MASFRTRSLLSGYHVFSKMALGVPDAAQTGRKTGRGRTGEFKRVPAHTLAETKFRTLCRGAYAQIVSESSDKVYEIFFPQVYVLFRVLVHQSNGRSKS